MTHIERNRYDVSQKDLIYANNQDQIIASQIVNGSA